MQPDTTSGREPRVRVFALGRFQVEVDGAPLMFKARAERKPLELLKVLIAQGGQQVSEDTLNEALWPDSDGDAAHRSFTTNLHRLRRLIGQEALLLQDRRLTLDKIFCWVDVEAFTTELRRASAAAGNGDGEETWSSVERALDLYRGPFLDGEFDPPEILTAREQVHGTFLRHLKTLGAHFEEQGEPRRALRLYERGLEIDPLAEELYLASMRNHMALGQAAEGIATYRRCRDMLDAGAGIRPSPEVERLHQALLASRQDAARPDSPASPPLPDFPAHMMKGFGHWPAWSLIGALVVVAAGLILLVSWLPVGIKDDASNGLPLPEEPSIAVLAFENLGGDPEQDYFANGFSNTLTTQLYKIPEMFVIARQTAAVYRDKGIPVSRIGRELGVRYVLDGSVQRQEGRVRINVQLIEAATERHVWAEKYDRELKDIFAVQDEIIRNIAMEVGARTSWGDLLRTRPGATGSYKAYDLYLLADQYYAKFEKQAMARAKELLAQSIEADPTFARAVAFMGWVRLMEYLFKWSDDPQKSFRDAEAWGRKALELDETVYLGYTLMGRILMFKGRHEEAVEMTARAVSYEPNNAIAHFSLALQLVYAGHLEEAFSTIDRAMRMAPFPPSYFLFVKGYTRALTGRHKEAIEAFRAYVKRQPTGPQALRTRAWLIVSLMELERVEEAREETTRLLKNVPSASVQSLIKLTENLPFKDHAFLKRHAELLQRAGLPPG